VMMMNMEY
jgi:hypothetical protein